MGLLAAVVVGELLPSPNGVLRRLLGRRLLGRLRLQLVRYWLQFVRYWLQFVRTQLQQRSVWHGKLRQLQLV